MASSTLGSNSPGKGVGGVTRRLCSEIEGSVRGCQCNMRCRGLVQGVSEAHRSVGRPKRWPIGAVVCGDPRGIRWGSPRDPQPKVGIRVISVPVFTGDPPAELQAFIILISEKGERKERAGRGARGGQWRRWGGGILEFYKHRGRAMEIITTTRSCLSQTGPGCWL